MLTTQSLAQWLVKRFYHLAPDYSFRSLSVVRVERKDLMSDLKKKKSQKSLKAKALFVWSLAMIVIEATKHTEHKCWQWDERMALNVSSRSDKAGRAAEQKQFCSFIR